MRPILFEFFGVSIFSFSFFLILGALIALFWTKNILESRNLTWSIFFDHLIFYFLMSFFIGRILFFVFSYEYLEGGFWSFFDILDGNTFSWGNILGFWGAVMIIVWKEKQNILEWLDLLIAPFLLFLSFLALGQFLAQPSVALPTDLPWGIEVEGVQYPLGFMHPIELYTLFALLSILVIISVIRVQRLFSFHPGTLFFLAIGIYALYTEIMHPFYLLPLFVLGSISMQWVFSLGISFICIIALLILNKHWYEIFLSYVVGHQRSLLRRRRRSDREMDRTTPGRTD